MTPLVESLTKAHDCSGFVVDDMRAALHHAGPIEGIVVMTLIEGAVALRRLTGELLRAVELEAKK